MEHLVIEGNSTNRFIIKSYLNKIGYNTTEVSNGQDALDLVKNDNKYDAIWTAIDVPKVNGINMTKTLRNDLNYKGPIIGITGYCDFNSVKCCMDAGMNDVLQKPLQLDELKKCANNLNKLDI